MNLIEGQGKSATKCVGTWAIVHVHVRRPAKGNVEYCIRKVGKHVSGLAGLAGISWD